MLAAKLTQTYEKMFRERKKAISIKDTGCEWAWTSLVSGIHLNMIAHIQEKAKDDYTLFNDHIFKPILNDHSTNVLSDATKTSFMQADNLSAEGKAILSSYCNAILNRDFIVDQNTDRRILKLHLQVLLIPAFQRLKQSANASTSISTSGGGSGTGSAGGSGSSRIVDTLNKFTAPFDFEFAGHNYYHEYFEEFNDTILRSDSHNKVVLQIVGFLKSAF